MHWAALSNPCVHALPGSFWRKLCPPGLQCQWCLVFPAPLWCQWEQCRLRKGGLRNGWALGRYCQAPSQLLLAQYERGTIRVGESALRNYDVTPKVRAAVTTQREEGGYSSTRKFCLCHHVGKHLHAAGLSSAPEQQCCSDAKEGRQPVLFPFSLRDSF